MKNIKIIKRQTRENVEPPVIAAPKITPDATKLRRDATAVITGWISDWRGRERTDARAAFNNLFEPFEV